LAFFWRRWFKEDRQCVQVVFFGVMASHTVMYSLCALVSSLLLGSIANSFDCICCRPTVAVVLVLLSTHPSHNDSRLSHSRSPSNLCVSRFIMFASRVRSSKIGSVCRRSGIACVVMHVRCYCGAWFLTTLNFRLMAFVLAITLGISTQCVVTASEESPLLSAFCQSVYIFWSTLLYKCCLLTRPNVAFYFISCTLCRFIIIASAIHTHVHVVSGSVMFVLRAFTDVHCTNANINVSQHVSDLAVSRWWEWCVMSSLKTDGDDSTVFLQNSSGGVLCFMYS